MTATTAVRQELHDTSGQTYAYIVPAGEMQQLLDRVAELTRHVKQLTYERDRHWEQVNLLTPVATLEQEEEIMRAIANNKEVSISELIAEFNHERGL